MQCARHPDVETELTCSKCGTPICPRCLYHTPVGARCRTCANIRRLPMFEASPTMLARGGAAALAVGAALGALWGAVVPFGPFLLFALVLGLGLGYAIGEAVSRATNRRLGTPYQALAAAGVLVAYLVRSVVLASGLRGLNVDLLDVLTDDLFGWAVVLVGVVVAMGRIR